MDLPGHSSVDSCEGTVILDDVEAVKRLSIRNSRDVRLWSMGQPGARLQDVSVDASRLELVDCRAFGSEGFSGGSPGFNGFDGNPAIRAFGSSRVHVSRSSATGGKGGSCNGSLSPCWGGNGGSGIEVAQGSELIVTGGGSSWIDGGLPGFGYGFFGYGGFPGIGIDNQGMTWHSGAVISSTSGGTNQIGPWDPTLSYSGTPVPGSVLTVTMTARDGSGVYVVWGRPTLWPDPGSRIEMLVTGSRRNVVHLGVVQSGNQVDLPWMVPSNAQPGDMFVMQGLMRLQNGTSRRTNSLPVVVR